MAVDSLQARIRKTKNPMLLELGMAPGQLPPAVRTGNDARDLGSFCRTLLEELREQVPGVRFRFSAFALLGPEGLMQLQGLLKEAAALGYYVLLDAPAVYSAADALQTAEALFGENAQFPCNGAVVSAWPGSDAWKPFLPCCEQDHDLFVLVRSVNKSASELQELRTGTRQAYTAAADYVNRIGAETLGKYGYARVGFLAAATAPDSLKNLRTLYPKRFIIADGGDASGANAKNCSLAFDRLGYGAAACFGPGVTCAWNREDSDGADYAEQALAAVLRIKKNLSRYVTVL